MTTRQRISYLNASLALTLLVAGTAVADDTELLLTTAESSAKPSVLFILDTSGSMNTLEHTIAFFDSAITYAGSCDIDSFYWSDTGFPPACDSKRQIANANFVCASASVQVTGVGSYTGIVAQYRSGTGSGDKWQTLSTSAAGAIVECEQDSGIHGDGTPGDVFAKAGTGGANFTNNPDEEIDWASYPTNLTYTLYDGNYLNWRETPANDNIKRIDIVKTVLKKVLSAYDEVNLALMRFNNNNGGPVIHAMGDLKTDRAEVNAKLDAITALGNTPLSETFYEGALYWQGLATHYGIVYDDYDTDPDALAALSPPIYKAPPTVAGSCPRNFNIILTDGLPKNDADTELLAPTLPGWEEALGGRTVCDDYVDDGDCLDDISEYLSKHDINATEPGGQFVKTFAVGFLTPQDAMDRLEETTEITGGKFFTAEDPESLAVSLLSIFDEITEQSLTFTSPAVAVNAFNRTQNLNDLYMTVFESANKTHWPGNLKKYRIVDSTITDANGALAVDPATGFFAETAKSFWTVGAADGAEVTIGGAANLLPDPTTRRLYTNNGGGSSLKAGSNVLTPSNDAAFVVEDFGLTGAKGEPTIAEIIRWANGEDIADEDNDPATTARNVMGDPLHSQPAAIDYGTGGASDVVVYAATNDGYLHAIDGATGTELWSFVPRELLGSFAKLYFNPTDKFKHYGIDGNITPVVFDENRNGEVDGNDFIYIVFGLRRGGNSYYALDVTDRNSPKLLWNVSYPEFGQSWSSPVIAKVDSTAAGLNALKAVVIFGAGYDTAHDSQSAPAQNDGEGAGIFMLDLESGATIWRAGIDVSADLTLNVPGREMTRAFPTAIKVIDINGDGFADRMYAADVGGQLWRFDISSGNPVDTLVAGGIIARFGFEGSVTPDTEGPRRIYNSPDVAVFTDTQQNRRYIAVNIGSGYRAHPLNTSAVDRFFSLRDPDVFNQLSQAEYNSYNIATDADMIEVSGQKQTVITSADRGWRFTLPPTQMILADSTTFNDSIFFVGFSPAATSVIDCDSTFGKNFLYQVSVINGDPLVPNLDELNPADADAARVKTLAQGGIAPSLTVLFPSPDPDCVGDTCKIPPLGCVGVECFDPGFENNPVRTLWTQDGIE
jgi:type IV pilus assembly protein PilY1